MLTENPGDVQLPAKAPTINSPGELTPEPTLLSAAAPVLPSPPQPTAPRYAGKQVAGASQSGEIQEGSQLQH